jgi:hypothetical protein
MYVSGLWYPRSSEAESTTSCAAQSAAPMEVQQLGRRRLRQRRQINCSQLVSELSLLTRCFISCFPSISSLIYGLSVPNSSPEEGGGSCPARRGEQAALAARVHDGIRRVLERPSQLQAAPLSRGPTHHVIEMYKDRDAHQSPDRGRIVPYTEAKKRECLIPRPETI